MYHRAIGSRSGHPPPPNPPPPPPIACRLAFPDGGTPPVESESAGAPPRDHPLGFTPFHVHANAKAHDTRQARRVPAKPACRAPNTARPAPYLSRPRGGSFLRVAARGGRGRELVQAGRRRMAGAAWAFVISLFMRHGWPGDSDRADWGPAADSGRVRLPADGRPGPRWGPRGRVGGWGVAVGRRRCEAAHSSAGVSRSWAATRRARGPMGAWPGT